DKICVSGVWSKEGSSYMYSVASRHCRY
ncbi:hypothetical protein CISIN_1g0234411mg, partial [Citrus sinensis]